ncbi:MAG TPA: hypothetical protein VIL00_10985 [Pseudonocardiaceae bacterium]
MGQQPHHDPKTRSAPKGIGRHVGPQQWKENTDEYLSPSSVIKICRVFSALLAAAMVAGRIPANPCSRIKLPKLNPPDERFLTREEYARLRTSAPMTPPGCSSNWRPTRAGGGAS